VRPTTAVVLLTLGLAVPAAAQRPALPPARPAPRRVLPPLPPEPPISFRPYVMGAESAFAAVDTFKAVFDKSHGTFFGGGLQVTFQGKYYVEVGASRFKQTGQRAFFANGQSFGLGIPLTARITPLEITAGYRFRPRSMPKLRPYLGGGLTSYAYEEQSNFDEPGDGLTTRGTGLVGVGGVEFRVHKYVGITADGAVAHVTGILGQAGISKDIGESNLGGISARIRLIIGR
jgi:hypothetical protein